MSSINISVNICTLPMAPSGGNCRVLSSADLKTYKWLVGLHTQPKCGVSRGRAERGMIATELQSLNSENLVSPQSRLEIQASLPRLGCLKFPSSWHDSPELDT